MAGMQCSCCHEWIDFVTFAETSTGICSECSSEHDQTHPADWRD
jgi:hypothetical protein